MNALRALVEAVARNNDESVVAASRAELEVFLAAGALLAEEEQQIWAFFERARGTSEAEVDDAVEQALFRVLAGAKSNEASLARAEAAEKLLAEHAEALVRMRNEALEIAARAAGPNRDLAARLRAMKESEP